jgi:signal transduction histidine kinase/CheY-like chemotaxis protein
VPKRLEFLTDGGAMGARIRAHDWAATPLGPLEAWPPGLRTAVGIVIASRFPACLVWGPRLVTIYNDAFRPILGAKPEALGRPFDEVWAEAWHIIGPIAARAFAGEATFIEDFPLVVERAGHPEQAYFTFCYSPVRDEAGAIAGFLDTVVETTAKVALVHALREREEELRRLNEGLEERVAERTAELLRAEEHLRQAQKMESLGQLTGGVAHDFNNLLTSIIGNLELLESRIDDDSLKNRVRAASRSAERGANLTAQLLAFSRKQHLMPRPIDINVVLAEMKELLGRTLADGVEMRWKLANGLWPALADRTQVEVSLLNLMLNARDAMPSGGRIVIATRNVAENGRPNDLPAGDFIAVSVTDTGEGMSLAVLGRAMEPFFTTKPAGVGTGLGLSQVYGLARQSGGTVRIDSSPGEGTSVEIFLPRALTAAEPDAPRTRSATPASRRGTVLVVDDQQEVREVAATHLETLGYQTVQAESGQAAIALLESRGPAAFDALVVDYVMAGVSGMEVLRAARRSRPDIPVVLMTGYAGADALGERLQGFVLLKKPFRLHEFEAALDAAASTEPIS